MDLDLRKVKSKQIGFRLPQEEYEVINKIAKKEKVSAGEVVRAIVSQWINRKLKAQSH